MRKITNKEEKEVIATLNLYGLANDEWLKAIMESIIINGGSANYTKDIYPYIMEYYPNLYKMYKGHNHNFKARIICKTQQYTPGMSNFCGTGIFKSEGKGTGTFSLANN